MAAKAATLLHGLATCHGFIDGNKRTAWSVTELLIARSGWRLDIAADQPVDDLVVGVVERTISLAEAQAWFHDCLRRA